MLTDTFIASKRTFSFKNMYRGIAIKSLLLTLPMTTALVSLALGYDEFKWVLDYMSRAIILSEFISIITNFLSIRYNRQIKNPDVLAMFLSFFFCIFFKIFLYQNIKYYIINNIKMVYFLFFQNLFLIRIYQWHNVSETLCIFHFF